MSVLIDAHLISWCPNAFSLVFWYLHSLVVFSLVLSWYIYHHNSWQNFVWVIQKCLFWLSVPFRILLFYTNCIINAVFVLIKFSAVQKYDRPGRMVYTLWEKHTQMLHLLWWYSLCVCLLKQPSFYLWTLFNTVCLLCRSSILLSSGIRCISIIIWNPQEEIQPGGMQVFLVFLICHMYHLHQIVLIHCIL